MDACWHDSFYHCVLEHICGDTFDLERLKDVIDCKRQGFMGATNVVNYLTNHDHNHVLAELGERGILDDEAFKRRKLGAVITMTSVGVPLLWMGEEFGEYKYKTQEQAKIDWTLLGNDLNKGLFEFCKGLIHLRKTNHALYTENIEFIHENPEAKVFAYSRWNGEGSRVVVVANFSENFLAGYHVPNFPEAGTWHEWTANYDIEAGEDGILIDLGGMKTSEVQAIQSQAQSVSQADNQCCWSNLQPCDCSTSSVLPDVGQALELRETSETYCQAAEA
jgi:1,4-alpha-glucan branching enzyme